VPGKEDSEIVQLAAQAFNRMDAEAFAALCAEDVEMFPMRAALEGAVYRGPDAAQELFSALADTWAELEVEVDETKDGPDGLLSLGRFRGRGRGSGAAIDVQAAWLIRTRDGLVTYFRAYTDPDQAREDAGLK
jgi:ketosteroid isomerase-like protein